MKYFKIVSFFAGMILGMDMVYSQQQELPSTSIEKLEEALDHELTHREAKLILKNEGLSEELNMAIEEENKEEHVEFSLLVIESLPTKNFYLDAEEYYFEEIEEECGILSHPTELNIPGNLVLNNGQQIRVKFGNSKDGVPSDLPVSELIIEAIVHALNFANSQLPANETIRELYIKTTRNGEHSNCSNHYSGNAVDISRINGTKIFTIRKSRQVEYFQKAFNSYYRIRENFGPSFKHKFFIERSVWDRNYDVDGHNGHIHIAVR